MPEQSRIWIKEGKKQVKTIRITTTSDSKGLRCACVEPTRHFKVRR